MMKSLLAVVLLSGFATAIAQDPSLSQIALEHKQVIHYNHPHFSGGSFDSLVNKIARHRYVLIGEAHHTN